MTTTRRCTYGGGLLRRGCGRPALIDCVYCGRPFCEEHGERGADFMDVCVRKRCQTKREDLEAHNKWKTRAEPANRVSVCADERCDARMRHQCSRCKLVFCATHLRQRRVRDTSRQPSVDVQGMVCAHCAGRRKIWG